MRPTTATGMLPTATRIDAIVPAVSRGLSAKHPLPVARKVVRGTGVRRGTSVS